MTSKCDKCSNNSWASNKEVAQWVKLTICKHCLNIVTCIKHIIFGLIVSYCIVITINSVGVSHIKRKCGPASSVISVFFKQWPMQSCKKKNMALSTKYCKRDSTTDLYMDEQGNILTKGDVIFCQKQPFVVTGEGYIDYYSSGVMDNIFQTPDLELI